MQTTSKSRPRTKPAEQRRTDLMNAAQRLFLKHGVGPTTIEQITSGAAVAKGTFYLYFSSKEDILAALADRFAQELLARIKAAVEEKSKENWSGKLAAWATAAVNGYLDSIQLHDILFYGSRPSTREGMVDNIVIDYLAEMLQAGITAEAWRIGDPRFTAVFLFSGLHAAVDQAFIEESRVNRRQLVHNLKELCFRAVGLPSG